MSDKPWKRPTNEYEAVIRRIKGVLSATVSVDENGGPSDIHAVIGVGRSAGQVMCDIESALMVETRKRVEPQRVTIVQVSDETRALLVQGRYVLGQIAVTISPQDCEVRVKVASGGKYQESVERLAGGDSWMALLRTVARATLRCVEGFLEPLVRITLNEVAVVDIGTRRAALVSVICSTKGWREELLGSCLVRRDEREAVARAALDAVNRIA